MLHRIEVNVIDMHLQIALVPDRVLPIASLPDAAFTLVDSAGRSLFVFRKVSGKACLDLLPSSCEVAVFRRQGPDAVQMIG